MDGVNEHLKCVKCGEVVEQVDKYLADRLGIPACCENHLLEVIAEVEKDFPMWPSGWYGHAWKSSGDSNWRYDDWKPESQK